MKLGLIGGGQMASAIINGVIKSQKFTAEQILASDANTARCAELEEAFAVKITSNNVEVVNNCEVVILAVKPHIMPKVLQELNTSFKPGQMLISVAAGITISSIEQMLLNQPKIVRVMPNTPCLIGQGVSAICLGPGCGLEEQQLVMELFGGLGTALLVEEEQMNAVTAVSGSGPAYVFLFIEALIDAGVKLGLPRDVARRLAADTVSGAAEMVKQTGKHPAELKDMVTSPGGTTITALLALEANGFRHSISSGVLAAEKRAQELKI